MKQDKYIGKWKRRFKYGLTENEKQFFIYDFISILVISILIFASISIILNIE